MPNVIDESSGTLLNGLPAPVMRQAIESKNLLNTKGALYVGTGNSANISIPGVVDNYTVYRTGVIAPNGSEDDGKLLVYNSSSDSGFDKVNPSQSLVANFANGVDLNGSASQDTNGINIDIGAPQGNHASIGIPIGTDTSFGVVKLVDSLGCNATDTAVSANAISGITNFINMNNTTRNVSVGYNNTINTNVTGAVLIGNNSTCSNSGESSRGIVLIGNRVRSRGICIGENSSVNDTGGVCIGVNGWVQNTGGVCIGVNSTAYRGVSIGSNSHSGDDGVSIGPKCSATGSAIAIGYNVNCETLNAIALGQNAHSVSGIAIGSKAVSSTSNSIAIGQCSSTPESAYGGDGFCVAVGSYTHALYDRCSAFGASSDADGSYCTAIGYGSYASGNYCTAIGTGARASSNHVIQIGDNSDSNITTYVKNLQTANSDIRIKEEVEDANTSICLQNVRDLKIHRYKFKNFVRGQYDIHQIGWVADELMNFYPKSVHQKDAFFEDVDENGNVIYDIETDENGNEIRKPKTIKIENLKSIDFHLTAVPILWGAVQELSKKIDALEQENLQLKERINSL